MKDAGLSVILDSAVERGCRGQPTRAEKRSITPLYWLTASDRERRARKKKRKNQPSLTDVRVDGISVLFFYKSKSEALQIAPQAAFNSPASNMWILHVLWASDLWNIADRGH